MKKDITIAEFASELKSRLLSGETVDCCKEELITLADIISEKIGNEKIAVNWHDKQILAGYYPARQYNLIYC